MTGVPSWRAGKEDVLKRRFSFQLNGTSSNRTGSPHVGGNRVYRLYRNEFEAERMGAGRFMCRSQSENTDVGDAQDLINSNKNNENQKKKKKGEDIGLLNKKVLPSVAAGNGAVHVNGSLIEKEKEEALVEAASRTWWGRLPRRYIIVGLCFIAFLLCNMDRVQCAFFPLLRTLNHRACGGVCVDFHLVGKGCAGTNQLLVTIWSLCRFCATECWTGIIRQNSRMGERLGTDRWVQFALLNAN